MLLPAQSYLTIRNCPSGRIHMFFVSIFILILLLCCTSKNQINVKCFTIRQNLASYNYIISRKIEVFCDAFNIHEKEITEAYKSIENVIIVVC